MKRPHTKYFFIFYVIALMMMSTPLVNIANQPVLVLGMPMILTWVLGWTLLTTLVLCWNYQMDIKYDKARKK